MPKPLLWMEIRCNEQTSETCEGGIEGEWQNSAAGMDQMVAAAKRHFGWSIIDHEIVCPSCANKL